MILFWLPLSTFALVAIGERLFGRRGAQPAYSRWDWALNLVGFAIQGAIIPLCGYFISVRALPAIYPQLAGALKTGAAGAFLLNFVFIDFLYYWQHRLFHRSEMLWKLHECHHSSGRVDIWATARNTVITNFLFVYMLINPVLGYLVDAPEAFYAGAMLTASLDLVRHTSIDFGRLPFSSAAGSWIAAVFVTPRMHHQHHSSDHYHGNYGANLILWDKLFGTYLSSDEYPRAYGVRGAQHPLTQLIYPLGRKRKLNVENEVRN